MKRTKKFSFSKAKLIFLFSISVFVIVTSTFTIVTGFFIFVNRNPYLDIAKLPSHTGQYVIAFTSIIIGLILAYIFKRAVLNPLYDISNAAEELSRGNYDVHVRVRGLRILRTVCEKINTTAEDLSSVETLRSDFINNFSHEFKTPIISISGFAKILRTGQATPEEANEYLDIIINESQRLTNLSTNILNLSKLETKTTLSNLTHFNVSEQIRMVIILLDNKWSNKNIEINFESDEYMITADKNLLQQLWTNLIDNAYKYSDENSKIEIYVNKDKDSLIFLICDSGHGMTDLEVKHAFDRFYQGDIKHKSGGNGLGLAVAKRVCELHNGEISIESSDETGTVFKVILPINQ